MFNTLSELSPPVKQLTLQLAEAESDAAVNVVSSDAFFSRARDFCPSRSFQASV